MFGEGINICFTEGLTLWGIYRKLVKLLGWSTTLSQLSQTQFQFEGLIVRLHSMPGTWGWAYRCFEWLSQAWKSSPIRHDTETSIALVSDRVGNAATLVTRHLKQSKCKPARSTAPPPSGCLCIDISFKLARVSSLRCAVYKSLLENIRVSMFVNKAHKLIGS